MAVGHFLANSRHVNLNTRGGSGEEQLFVVERVRRRGNGNAVVVVEFCTTDFAVVDESTVD